MIVAGPEHKAEIEAIFNHPEVRAACAQDGAPDLDVTPYLKPPHISLLMRGGCFLGAWDGLGRFECHTAFLPEHRGANAILEADKALRHVFINTFCYEVATKVPQCNQEADSFTRRMGFRKLFQRDGAWVKNGERYAIKYYLLDMDAWIMQGHCVESGRWFHNELSGKAGQLKQHPEDHVHDCYVGATVDMIKAGNTDKGILFYNRWARLAGYHQIVKVSDDPLVLDMSEFKLTVKDGEFTVEG